MLTKTSAVLFTIFIVMITSQSLWGANGSIEGKVTDSSTGEPLIGVNIVLQGTSMGAATDLDGRYLIPIVPAGPYTMKVSYIGYKSVTLNVQVKDGERLSENIKLEGVGVTGKEVIVTAQASGQNAAINKQVSSSNIVNVVSSARIQELPDANAAESIGRLPGISLVRNGGEATQVVIRGLQPQYNMITIDGVQIPANDAGNVSISGSYAAPTNNLGGRAVDLSMVSSNSLEGIEVYKTVTPDMDAAVLGGTVNFTIREAKRSSTGIPSISLLAQGAYNDLMSTYKDYKFVASIENRFFDDRLGVFVQGIVQRQNLTANQLGSSQLGSNLIGINQQPAPYYIPNKQFPNSIALGSLNISFSPNVEQRYNGTLTLDYRIPNGKIALMNLISHGKTTNETHSETYDLKNYGNDIQFGTQMSSNEINLVTNILEYEQTISSLKIDVKLSNSYSDNRTPNGWQLTFDQLSAGTTNIPNNEDPIQIAKQAAAMIDVNKMVWQGNSTWSSFNKQDDKQASFDLETNFNPADFVSVTLKGGGQYKYTTRYNNFDDGFGSLYSGSASGFRKSLVQALPWLAQAPYNFDPTGNQNFFIHGFYDPNMNFGKFLKGDYGMYSAVNAGVIDQIMNEIKILGAAATQPQQVPSYLPDPYSSTASDYYGNEFRSAEYLMATINIGPQVTIIPGVRYQGLKTSYTAAHFIGNADQNPYPLTLNYTMVTQDEYHGYLLPDVILKYSPFNWLSFRGSYTSSLAYPDFSTIIPRLDVASNTGHWVVWNNYALKPAYSQNFDFQAALYNNEIGLLAVSPFLKRIDNLIFSQRTSITDPTKYPGVPANTKTFSLTTYINNPNRVDVWGIEAEWQTHFWYLPGVLSGLVLNANYTHIFSEATYPYTTTVQSTVYPFLTTNVDTTYTDRLIQQPNDVVNLSLGFDYDKFSILASMIYQAQIYSGTDFWNSLRSDKAKYLRWDLSVKQGLPWYDIEVFFDLNNINSEEDVYAVRGSGYPNLISNYGLTADLGFRWRLE